MEGKKCYLSFVFFWSSKATSPPHLVSIGRLWLLGLVPTVLGHSWSTLLTPGHRSVSAAHDLVVLVIRVSSFDLVLFLLFFVVLLVFVFVVLQPSFSIVAVSSHPTFSVSSRIVFFFFFFVAALRLATASTPCHARAVNPLLFTGMENRRRQMRSPSWCRSCSRCACCCRCSRGCRRRRCCCCCGRVARDPRSGRHAARRRVSSRQPKWNLAATRTGFFCGGSVRWSRSKGPKL